MNLVNLTNDISITLNNLLSSVLDSNLANEIRVGLGEKTIACHEAAKTVFQKVINAYDTTTNETKMNVAILTGSFVGLSLFLQIRRLSQKVDALEKKQSQNEKTQNYLKECNLVQRDVISRITPFISVHGEGLRKTSEKIQVL